MPLRPFRIKFARAHQVSRKIAPEISAKWHIKSKELLFGFDVPFRPSGFDEHSRRDLGGARQNFPCARAQSQYGGRKF